MMVNLVSFFTPVRPNGYGKPATTTATGEPRFGGATKTKNSSPRGDEYLKLLAKLPDSVASSLAVGMEYAHQRGDRDLTPLHLLYGAFMLIHEGLLPDTDPPEAVQHLIDAFLPSAQRQKIDPARLVQVAQMIPQVVKDYLDQSTRLPRNGEITIHPLFSKLLEQTAQSDKPLSALINVLKKGPEASFTMQDLRNYGNSYNLSTNFGHCATILNMLDENLLIPSAAIQASVTKAKARQTTPVPAFSMKETMKHLNSKSPTLYHVITLAQNIAQQVNAPTVEPIHVALALFRNITEFQTGMAKFVSAAPDEIPAEMKVQNTVLYPRASRIMLDSLLPESLRQGLTEAQLKSMTGTAETEIEQLVYAKGRTILEHAKLPNPPLSQDLREVLTRISVTDSEQDALTGQYPYAFTQELKAVLAASPKQTNQRLAQILNDLTEQGEKKSAMIPAVTFEDIGGYESAKTELEAFIDMNLNPEKYLSMGISKNKIQKGAMLYGPPGTGKTHFAKAIANKMKLPFFAVNGADFVRKYVGTGPENVQKLFAEARKHGKALIFIDEADALLGHRSAGGDGGSDERDNTLNTILTEMDGINDNAGIIVIGATNRLDKIDEAALRPGRFGKKVEIAKPNKDDRLAILKVHTQQMPLGKNVDLATVARMTRGCSSADMANLASEAAMFAFEEVQSGRRARNEIIHTDFDEAFDRIEQGPKSLVAPTENDLRVVANHEVLGHGLIAYALDWQLRTISTIGRRNSAGHVSYMPPEGFAKDTLKYCLEDLLMTLAGRAAEEVTLGRANVTGGARGDYDQARERIVNMMSSGHMTGYNAVNYDARGKTPLSAKDEALVSFLLDRSLAVAKEMVQVVTPNQRKAIEKDCMKRMELRWDAATQFFKDRISVKQKTRLQALSNGFVNEVLDLLDRKVQERYQEFIQPVRGKQNPFNIEKPHRTQKQS